MSDPITLSHEGDVAVITLSNPPVGLFTPETFPALARAIDGVEGSGARALIWQGSDKIFSGGVDVSMFQELASHEDAAQRGEQLWRDLVGTVARLEALPIPTIALCHGVTLTAAFEVALGCDVLWAGESASFGLVERVVGLSPGAGGVQRLTERTGPGNAREFIYSGGRYDAETMRRWGVVQRIIADDELHEAGLAFAADLAAGPTRAMAATKAVVRATLDGGVRAADAAMPAISGSLFATEDLRGAVDSFLSEGPGKARFEGR